MIGARDYRQTASIMQAVGVRRIDDGVYVARGGRWRIVSFDKVWLVTDGWRRVNRGRSMIARTLYDGRCMIGAAENTEEGRMTKPWTLPPGAVPYAGSHR